MKNENKRRKREALKTTRRVSVFSKKKIKNSEAEERVSGNLTEREVERRELPSGSSSERIFENRRELNRGEAVVYERKKREERGCCFRKERKEKREAGVFERKWKRIRSRRRLC